MPVTGNQFVWPFENLNSQSHLAVSMARGRSSTSWPFSGKLTAWKWASQVMAIERQRFSARSVARTSFATNLQKSAQPS
jgi:hypothetical protein